MKRHMLTATLLSTLCLASNPAVALDFQQSYVGAGLGLFNLNSGAGGSDNAFGAYGLLGIDFLRYDFLGVEMRVGTTDDAAVVFANAGTTTFVQHGVDYFVSLLAKAHYDVSRSARVYGLAGLSSVKTSTHILRAGVVTGSTIASKTVSDFSFGFGLDYRCMDDFLVACEWLLYNPDISAFAISMKYEF